MNLRWSNFVTQANKCDRRGGSQGQNASPYIYYKSSLPEVFCKEFVFKNFAKFSGWGLQLYLKETLAQCFPVNFCEVFKNMFLHRTPPETASAISFRQAIFIQHVHFLNKIQCLVTTKSVGRHAILTLLHFDLSGIKP